MLTSWFPFLKHKRYNVYANLQPNFKNSTMCLRDLPM